MRRIMPYKRKKTRSLTLDEADGNKLETFSKRRNTSMKEIVGFYIQLDEDYDLWSADWKDKVKKSEDQRERYTLLDGSCPALAFADNVWKCLWGQDGKPPAIKTLAKDLDEALELCAACTKTLKIKLENESYQVKVQELEMKLKENSTKKFKIPQCNNGARLDSDGLSFEGCPRSPGKPVSIEGYCKKLKNGAGCDWFKTRLIGVGAETS